MISRDGQSVGTLVFRQNAGNTSIVDLPDDILIEIHKYLDIRNRFKIRLNRRLNQINFPVLNIMEYMHIHVSLKCKTNAFLFSRTFHILDLRARKSNGAPEMDQ